MSGWYSAHLILIQQTAILAILAFAFQVVLRSGVFSFAAVGFYAIGAYAAANLSKHGVGLAPTLLIIIAASAAVGYLLAMPLVRLRGLYLGMVTFAFDQILVVVADNGGKLTGGSVGLFGVSLTVASWVLILLAVLAALLISQLERRSLGRALTVIKVDEQLARSMGVEIVRQRNFIFALSAGLGALSGALNTVTTSSVAPTGFGFDLIVTGLTMAVVGGVTSYLGAVIGAIIVVWFPEVFSFVGSYKSLVYGVIIVLVVVFEPNGVLGLLSRAGRLVRRRAPLAASSEPGGRALPASGGDPPPVTVARTEVFR